MNRRLLGLLLITAFLVRGYNFSFPSFTSGEVRIAYRGFTLATYGKDELGRPFPLLFNSLKDYQLPVVSYLTASGEFIFGKTEFGARIPFIIIGVALVFLTYQIAKIFTADPFFWFISASVAAFSPPLIFLSKIPNETIVLTFIFTLLFYLLVSKRNLLIIMLTMVISVLISKQAWFILLPFTLFTLFFYQESTDNKRKFTLIASSATIVFLAFMLFLNVPQSKRSLSENNFSIFSDVTIKNGIDRLRGQGKESGWPQVVDRALFNKTHYLTGGFLHWLSNISPAIYFGQFDGRGELNYSYLGTWPKVLIIPFSLGLFFFVKTNNKQKRLLLFYFLLLTFPSMFVYPASSLELVILTLPFMVPIIAFGFEQFNKKITILILFLAIAELAINIFNVSPDYKNTTALRPSWINGLVDNVFEKSNSFKTAISDDIALDIVSYIEWYTPINSQAGFQSVPSPYKFRQYQLANIKIVGSDEKFTTCSVNEKMEIFASKRDLNKMNEFNIQTTKVYKDKNNVEKAYLVQGVCI